MLIIRQNQEVPFDRNSVVTVGSFDGVHRAHMALIGELVRRARQRNGRSVILTFDPHPKQVLSKDDGPIQLLSTTEERISLCAGLGVDLMYIIPFTYEFSRQSSREFYMAYVLNRVGVSEVVEGYDHHFGRDREGSIRELEQLGKEFGFTVTTVPPVRVGDEIVSSSAIRNHLKTGNVARALDLLGRPYAVHGIVQRGDGRGRSLGFPTANLKLSASMKLIPGNGIYLVRSIVGEQWRYGLASIGVRPTFKTDGTRTLEVHLFDFDRELYGEQVEVQFLRRLRDEEKFQSAEDLVRQMERDRAEGIRLAEEYEITLRAKSAPVNQKQ